MASLGRYVAAYAPLVFFVATACGGIAVFDPIDDGSGGGGSGGASSNSVVSSAVSIVSVSTAVSTTSSTSASSSSAGGAPPIPPLVETDFGIVTEGSPVSITPPPTALGVTGFARGLSPTAEVSIDQIIAPDTTPLVTDGELPGTLNNYDNFDIATASVPSTDEPQAMPLQNGNWTFVPDVISGGTQVEVELWYRQTLDGDFHGGAVDVNIFRVSTAASDSYVNQMVAGAIQGFADLSLGTVRNFTLSSSFSVVTENNFAGIYAETAGAPGKPVLNVMVVDLIDFGAFQPLGFAPGIPGNPLVQGSLQSAVVMMTTGDPVFDAGTLRHEAGHFAGLLHTSEQALGFHDRLADTPECPDVMNLNCPDLDNLMFPFAFPGSLLTVSSKQERVVQGSALYRGAVEEGGGFAAPLDGTSIAPTPAPVAARLGVAQPFEGWEDDRISFAAQRLLQSHWCQRSGVEPNGLLLSHVGVSMLLTIGLDRATPAFVRGRAIEHAVLGGLTNEQLDQVEALAADPEELRWVRIGAVRGLREVAPQRLARRGLRADHDPLVAALARR